MYMKLVALDARAQDLYCEINGTLDFLTFLTKAEKEAKIVAEQFDDALGYLLVVRLIQDERTGTPINRTIMISNIHIDPEVSRTIPDRLIITEFEQVAEEEFGEMTDGGKTWLFN